MQHSTCLAERFKRVDKLQWKNSLNGLFDSFTTFYDAQGTAE